jgi:hypothetical protein
LLVLAAGFRNESWQYNISYGIGIMRDIVSPSDDVVTVLILVARFPDVPDNVFKSA